MGITARGAWESVKRHFRELGHDTQTADFTVVGVGDMSGDVFGNGMLLSEHIRLVAAFDHRHIFLDPEPDAAASFRERQRLFDLPRSSWEDYDREADLRRRRDLPACGEVHPDHPAGAGGHRAGRRRHPAQPAGADEGDPHRAGGPVLERRHRHLREGVQPDQRRGGRQVQRRDPGGRQEPALPGRRRGRQPGLHPARPDRVRADRWPDLHRLHRQRGRGGLLRPRGEHQDPAQHGGRRRGAGRPRPRRAARPDDRRGRRAGAAGQLRPGAGDQQLAGPGRLAAAGAPPDDQRAGAGRSARPGAGGAAPGRGAGGTHRVRADRAGVRGAARVREDRAGAGDPRRGPRGRGVDDRRPGQVLPDADARAVRRPDGPAPAAPGHRHHGAGQRGDQPGWHLVRLPGRSRRRPRRRPT